MSKYFIEIDSKLAYNAVVAGLEKAGYKWTSGKEVKGFTPSGRFFFCLNSDALRLTWTSAFDNCERYLRDAGFKDGKHLFPLLLEDNV